MDDYIVYWMEDRIYATWVPRRQAEAIVADPTTIVTTWLRA